MSESEIGRYIGIMKGSLSDLEKLLKKGVTTELLKAAEQRSIDYMEAKEANYRKAE
ncbi:MAG: hypothetical protein WAN61_03420 [Minisyncoccia bacterium]